LARARAAAFPGGETLQSGALPRSKPDDMATDEHKSLSRPRYVAAFVLGLIGGAFVWVAAPYNNLVLGNAYISDDYFPPAAVCYMLFLCLVVNPLLRRFARKCALTSKELAVVFGMVLVASIVPGQGLLRDLPYSLAGAAVRVSRSRPLADAYAALRLPAQFFPDRLGFGRETPASELFLQELPPGGRIPWRAWAGPLLAWGAFLVPWWLMMTAVAVIVFPQWRDNERLPFPLLRVQQAIIEDPPSGRLYAPLFRRRSFWVAAGAVFGLHLFYGGNKYFPESVPAIPLSWDISRCFTEPPLSYLPAFVKYNRVHFVFVGIAFFMRQRVGFSIWAFQVLYALYIMLHRAYFPPFQYQQIADHRIGAFLVVPIGVLWLGRRQIARAWRSLAPGTRLDEEGRALRAASIAFAAGCLGMFLWFLWVHVHPLWALGLIVLSILFALAVARIVAETGLTLIAPDNYYVVHLARLIPLPLRTAASSFFAGVVGFFICSGNRLCTTVFMTHALGLDAEAPPRKRVRLAALLLAVLVISLVACGAVHLHASYHHRATLDGRVSPISYWATTGFTRTGERLLLEYVHRTPYRAAGYSDAAHIAFGAGLAALCQWLCQVSPRWPLHPVALLFAGNWYAHRVWISVFLGWLAKVLLLRYGGARTHRTAGPFFMGLIIGEMGAMAFWTSVTALLAACGRPYEVVDILPF